MNYYLIQSANGVYVEISLATTVNTEKYNFLWNLVSQFRHVYVHEQIQYKNESHQLSNPHSNDDVMMTSLSKYSALEYELNNQISWMVVCNVCGLVLHGKASLSGEETALQYFLSAELLPTSFYHYHTTYQN